MPLPTNVEAYSDVKSILDTALKIGGGRYELDNSGAAHNWRQRAYTFRKLLRLSAVHTNPYDEVVMTIDDSTVVIQLRSVQGTFTRLDGKRTKVEDSSPLQAALPEDSDLLEAALELVKEKSQ